MINKLKQLVQVQDEYINLLSDELKKYEWVQVTRPYMFDQEEHKSRCITGKLLREKISALKNGWK